MIDNREQAGVVHLRLQKSNLRRALLIVQGVINEAQRRGYAIGTRKNHGCEGGLGIVINGHNVEVVIKEESRRVDHVLTLDEQRRKDRGLSVYTRRFDSEWTGRLQVRRDHETFTPPLSADRQRWRLEDRLEQVLDKLEQLAAEGEERRPVDQRRRLEEKDAWEAATAQARRSFVEDFRSTWFRQQIAAHREAEDLRTFVSAARPQASDETAEWLDWALQRADGIDPLRAPLAIPAVPVPGPDDLKPFLEGWSPYGPERRFGW